MTQPRVILTSRLRCHATHRLIDLWSSDYPITVREARQIIKWEQQDASMHEFGAYMDHEMEVVDLMDFVTPLNMA